ncbi:MAG TPA: hypothetical protein VF803_00450, partial [Candidatus Paceibacterota bacterium]
TLSLIRRFSKRVQGTGLIQKVRGERYHSRDKSRNVKRVQKLKVIARREEVMELIKLGKMQEQAPRQRGRK